MKELTTNSETLLTGRGIRRQSTMKRLNVNVLLSFLNGYTNWSLSRKFGGYVLRFETDTGVKHRIKKFNPPKFESHESDKKKKNHGKKPAKEPLVHLEDSRHSPHKPPSILRTRLNSGGGSSEADSLSWDDYDVVDAHRRKTEANILEEEAESESISSSSISSKESSPEMHREGKILLQEMKELRKEIKKMGDTSVLENSGSLSREIQLLPTDYSIEELQEMMVKMEEEDRCWDSGYNEKEFSSDDREEEEEEEVEEARFKELSPEVEESPFGLEEVVTAYQPDSFEDEEEGAVSGSESLGSSIVVELSESSKNISKFIEPLAEVSPPLYSKNQKKRLRRQRSKLRHKNNSRYNVPIATKPEESSRGSRWSRVASLYKNASTPTPDKEIIAGMDSILGRETINRDLSPSPIIKGRTVLYKNLFAYEVSFCDTKERYKELLDKRYNEDQLQLESILEDSFQPKRPLGRCITVS